MSGCLSCELNVGRELRHSVGGEYPFQYAKETAFHIFIELLDKYVRIYK